MKVIKKGSPQKGWSKKFKCTGNGNKGGGCGAELLVEQDDIFHTYSHCRDETDTYNTFKCPECNVLTDLPSSVSLPFTPREPRKSDSGASYTGSRGSSPTDD
jgi:hypothetical protein